MSDLRVVEVEFEHPDSAALRAAQRAEIDARYGRADTEPGPAPSTADITVFYVAYRDGEPVGCAGIRQLDGQHGEIKRMFVAPRSRGTGVSTALLGALENFARTAGWERLVLETGDAQPDAVRFYEREGYTRIPNFGYYAEAEDSLCYEKVLFATDPAAETGCEGCE